MKIHPAARVAPERDRVHSAQGGRPARADGTATTTASATTSSTSDATAPAPSTVVEWSRKAPPGLQKVLARLEAMGAEGRNAGQTQAMERIARNLQRYLDHQGLAPAPAPSPIDANPALADPSDPAPVDAPLTLPPALPTPAGVTTTVTDLLPDPSPAPTADDAAAPTTSLLMVA